MRSLPWQIKFRESYESQLVYILELWDQSNILDYESRSVNLSDHSNCLEGDFDDDYYMSSDKHFFEFINLTLTY